MNFDICSEFRYSEFWYVEFCYSEFGYSESSPNDKLLTDLHRYSEHFDSGRLRFAIYQSSTVHTSSTVEHTHSLSSFLSPRDDSDALPDNRADRILSGQKINAISCLSPHLGIKDERGKNGESVNNNKLLFFFVVVSLAGVGGEEKNKI